MDNILYTVSAKKIKMNSMEDIEEEVNEIELPYENNNNHIAVMEVKTVERTFS